MSARRRGQTLVLFALSVLLLSLMVVLTLSFSVRVKEKIETQTVADSAAYSNAVATARTFNSIALLSRAQLAHMVAQAGANSLITFSSLYRGHLNNLGLAYISFMAPYPGDCANKWSITRACSCQTLGDLGIQSFWIFSEQMRIMTLWDSLDTLAGRQAAQRWNSAMALYAAEEAMYQVVLRNGKLEDQELARELVDRAMAGAPVADLYAPSNGDAITMREIAGGAQCTGDGAACDFNFIVASHHVAAAMGSRGWPFTTGGEGGTAVLNERLRKIVKPQNVQAQPFHPLLGALNPAILSAYWSASLPIPFVPPFDPTLHGLVPAQLHAKADGHGITRATYRKRSMAPIWQLEPLPFPPVPFPRGGGPMFNPICKPDPPPFQAPAYTLLSSGNPLTGSTHYWNFGTGFPIDFDLGARHNMMGIWYPGVWPLFVDYNYNRVDDVADVWGQPKNMAVIRRNHAARQDPWMMRFTSRFSSSGQQDFDSRGFTTAGGIDLSQQTAISTGIAYYHQVGQTYEQVPNLMNPYWRATLVPSNVDAQGETDPATLLNGMGLGDAADVYTSLKAVGYKGLH